MVNIVLLKSTYKLMNHRNLFLCPVVVGQNHDVINELENMNHLTRIIWDNGNQLCAEDEYTNEGNCVFWLDTSYRRSVTDTDSRTLVVDEYCLWIGDNVDVTVNVWSRNVLERVGRGLVSLCEDISGNIIVFELLKEVLESTYADFSLIQLVNKETWPYLIGIRSLVEHHVHQCNSTVVVFFPGTIVIFRILFEMTDTPNNV